MTGKNLFFIDMILAASGILSPPLALIAGIAYGMTLQHPASLSSGRTTVVQAAFAGFRRCAGLRHTVGRSHARGPVWRSLHGGQHRGSGRTRPRARAPPSREG